MNNADEPDQKQLRETVTKFVKKSGFPFQAKVQSILESSSKWKVSGVEVPWRYHDREEFIDIIAHLQNIYLVIECKKSGWLSKVETRHGIRCDEGTPKRTLVFLCKERSETSRTLITHHREELPDDEPDVVYGAQADEWKFAPPSREASICVTVDVDKTSRMLEHEVAPLVRGTHQHASSLYQYILQFSCDPREIFVPVFVTTSPLFAFDFNPENVDIETGEFDLDQEELKSVPWIRFRKAFMAEDSSSLDERTVFIVEAKRFEEFLKAFEVERIG